MLQWLRQYGLTLLLVALVILWFYVPKVTRNDAVAFAHAFFLEYCQTHALNPTQFHPPVQSVEGGRKDLVYVFRFVPQKGIRVDDVVVRINKDGESRVLREAGER